MNPTVTSCHSGAHQKGVLSEFWIIDGNDINFWDENARERESLEWMDECETIQRTK